ncbi:hypothetical protein A0H76_2769 [Hepatospora eriocheir]|uniref:Uncharacterized protein n=1 Tax=Hepatospora eriocheir TaxID=1081669 RepID=A0A1X0QEU8_9MICR|nr:hypothetical protein A0H76_2769 [Hepatospora eriocheir]
MNDNLIKENSIFELERENTSEYKNCDIPSFLSEYFQYSESMNPNSNNSTLICNFNKNYFSDLILKNDLKNVISSLFKDHKSLMVFISENRNKYECILNLIQGYKKFIKGLYNVKVLDSICIFRNFKEYICSIFSFKKSEIVDMDLVRATILFLNHENLEEQERKDLNYEIDKILKCWDYLFYMIKDIEVMINLIISDKKHLKFKTTKVEISDEFEIIDN